MDRPIRKREGKTHKDLYGPYVVIIDPDPIVMGEYSTLEIALGVAENIKAKTVIVGRRAKIRGESDGN